ncbi:hypothetical protein V8C44DRAFT_237708 [Trichoderma aethiopicum]
MMSSTPASHNTANPSTGFYGSLGCACLQSPQRRQEVSRYPTDTRLPERPLRMWKYRRRARHSGDLYQHHLWLWKPMYLATAHVKDHGVSTFRLRTSPGGDTFAAGVPSRYLAYSSLLSSSRRLLPSCFDFSLSPLAIHRATYLPPCCFVATHLLVVLSNFRSTVSTRHLCQSPPFREPPGPLLDLQSALCPLDHYGWLKRPHPSAHEQQNGHRRPT